jgi:ketosteroid isomerase-like protein
MKTRCVFPLIVVAAFMIFSQPAIADDLADLKATYKTLLKALSAGDLETAFGHIHDGYVYLPTSLGFPIVVNQARAKPIWAKWFETHRWLPRPYKTDFRVIGNTGLTWGVRELTIINKNKGSTTRHSQKFSQTWLKFDGKWKLVMGHYSPIPSKQSFD